MRQRITNLLRTLANKLEPNQTLGFATWYVTSYTNNGPINHTISHRPRPRTP